MVNIDNLVNEWAYRCEKGYPDMDSPSDLRLLKVILKEQGITMPQFQEQAIIEKEEVKDISQKELIDLINKEELSPIVISKLFKIIKGSGLRPQFRQHLDKVGYTADSFAEGEDSLNYILDRIGGTEGHKLLEYLPKAKKLKDIPKRGNFADVLGLSPTLIQDLIQISPGADFGGSSIGKLEVFLALTFKDVNNRSGGGDLNWEGVGNLEVKGKDGRMGQQGGRGNFIDGVNLLADKFIPQGDEREKFESNRENRYMNKALKNIYEIAIKLNHKPKEIIEYTQKLLDQIYWGKGIAKKYFNSPDDFKDLAKMRNSLFKLNIEAYAEKTNVDAFLFAETLKNEYAIIDIDKVGEAVDDGSIITQVDPELGYFWHNPNPSIKLGKK